MAELAPETDWEIFAVSTRVNDPHNDDSGCITPAPELPKSA